MEDKIIEVFNDNIGVQVESVDNYGSTSLQKLSDLQIGAGNQAFKADSSGIWLGADKFVDAPYKVDMNGNTTMNNAYILLSTNGVPSILIQG